MNKMGMRRVPSLPFHVVQDGGSGDGGLPCLTRVGRPSLVVCDGCISVACTQGLHALAVTIAHHKHCSPARIVSCSTSTRDSLATPGADALVRYDELDQLRKHKVNNGNGTCSLSRISLCHLPHRRLRERHIQRTTELDQLALERQLTVHTRGELGDQLVHERRVTEVRGVQVEHDGRDVGRRLAETRVGDVPCEEGEDGLERHVVPPAEGGAEGVALHELLQEGESGGGADGLGLVTTSLTLERQPLEAKLRIALL